jgi:hypothetical protein
MAGILPGHFFVREARQEAGRCMHAEIPAITGVPQ